MFATAGLGTLLLASGGGPVVMVLALLAWAATGYCLLSPQTGRYCDDKTPSALAVTATRALARASKLAASVATTRRMGVPPDNTLVQRSA
jgi:hypothetical protein